MPLYHTASSPFTITITTYANAPAVVALLCIYWTCYTATVARNFDCAEKELDQPTDGQTPFR